MSAAVLTILGDASGVKRALGETVLDARRASAAIHAQSRADASVRRQELSNDGAMARAKLREEAADRRAAASDRARQDRAAQAVRERGMQRESALARRAAADAAALERARTAVAGRESVARLTVASREATARMNLDDRAAARAERDERRRTTVAEREERRRTRVAEQEARKRARAQGRIDRENRATGREAGGAIAQVATQVVTDAHGQIQNARQVLADRASGLNTVLGQRGTSVEENALDSAAIQRRLAEVRTGVAPEVALQAIAGAQSFANALGGNTRAERERAVQATLSDVEFAGAVDPTNVSGIVNMGAVLRRRVSDASLRQRILRGAVGTSFEGSVEVDNMIGAGLPGLLQAISAGTANAQSPEERDRLTAEISQDFFAQLQAQAAGGRTVGVSANRTNTVRTALSNEPRQNRLGLALAERARTGTDAQRAAFAEAFTKDRVTGEYRMNTALRDTPSNAARFFGTMFDNDEGALRNFMGAHGGGGARQLMNAPDVSALGSYFGMTTGNDGSQIREYDHVEQLKRASLTPEQEATLTRQRAAEDRTRLLREQETHLAASRPGGALTRASDAATTFANEHPWIAALGASVGTTALGAGAKALGGKVVGALGAGPAALALGSAVGGTALAAYGSSIQASTGLGPDGRPLSTGERVGKGLAAAAGPALFPVAALITAVQELTTAAREFRRSPMVATVSPHDAAFAGAGNGSSPRMPPTP